MLRRSSTAARVTWGALLALVACNGPISDWPQAGSGNTPPQGAPGDAGAAGPPGSQDAGLGGQEPPDDETMDAATAADAGGSGSLDGSACSSGSDAEADAAHDAAPDATPIDALVPDAAGPDAEPADAGADTQPIDAGDGSAALPCL